MKIGQKRTLKHRDYYFNKEGLMVFTAEYHLKRGYCCKNNCLNCPYKLEISK
ncbi:DUF5522 domain-containing protein [Lacihabitans sp. LS3-19]|uniref:DUF5522 domain-containing protein n=1 Tax=Lacihabitans sp. LS3-19 TaxID=2487335 RepID=UPI0020CE12F1|nr:DUF5522 domain-containing protein [Lacihabitans sp. LS3-19]